MAEQELKSEVAQEKPRDKDGHFIKSDKPKTSTSTISHIEHLLSENVHYSKTQDDLLDVHIGNPLKRIALLLEEIKKQKAFSFTIKGSLGILGVALALSIFGIFGGSKMLCDKGTQSEIGTLRILQTTDPETSNIWLLGGFIDEYNAKFNPPINHQRVVLIKNSGETINIPYNQAVSLIGFVNHLIIATGQYDACSQVLKVTNPQSIETLQ